MRMFMGLVLFWLSTFGYLLFFKKKTKLPYEFILPMVFTLIGIIIFLAGILNMMREITVIVCLGGIIFLIYALVKKEFKFKNILNVNFLILFVIFLYLTVICGKMHLLHYDNFSHWGLIVKTMFMKNALPNFENAIIEFKDYQPGSACFIYYFGALTGKTEGSMIIAQNYLLVAYFFSLFIFTNSKDKNKIKSYILKVLVVVFFLFVLFGNILFNDLLVDTLVSVMSICSMAVLYYFRNDLKRAFIYVLPLSIYLFLVKNIGIVLVGFNCLGLLYLGFRNKKVKKGFIYSIITGIITVLFFYIWSRHVSYVYGDLSLYSKHALSSSNVLNELRAKGWDKIFEFFSIYLKHFMDVVNNMPNIYILGINGILILMIVLYKKFRKKTVWWLIICDVIYLLYYAILGVMYLLSMPWAEASYLAGFDRYMLTIVFIVIGLVLIYFINIVMLQKKISKVSCSLVCVMIIISLVVNFKFYISDVSIFIGNQNYKDTSAYKFDKILGTEKFSANYYDYYYVYAPETSKNDSGYLYYLSKFKLNTSNFLIVKDMYQFDLEVDSKYNKKIIVFDNDDDILDYIENNNYDNVSDRLYIKSEEKIKE